MLGVLHRSNFSGRTDIWTSDQELRSVNWPQKALLNFISTKNLVNVNLISQTMSVVEGHLATIRHLEAQLQDVRLRQGSRPSSAVPGRTYSVPASFDTDSPAGLATPPTGSAGEGDSPMPGETSELEEKAYSMQLFDLVNLITLRRQVLSSEACTNRCTGRKSSPCFRFAG